MLLALDIGLTGFALGVDGVEFLFQSFFGGFANRKCGEINAKAQSCELLVVGEFTPEVRATLRPIRFQMVKRIEAKIQSIN